MSWLRQNKHKIIKILLLVLAVILACLFLRFLYWLGFWKLMIILCLIVLLVRWFARSTTFMMSAWPYKLKFDDEMNTSTAKNVEKYAIRLNEYLEGLAGIKDLKTLSLNVHMLQGAVKTFKEMVENMEVMRESTKPAPETVEVRDHMEKLLNVLDRIWCVDRNSSGQTCSEEERTLGQPRRPGSTPNTPKTSESGSSRRCKLSDLLTGDRNWGNMSIPGSERYSFQEDLKNKETDQKEELNQAMQHLKKIRLAAIDAYVDKSRRFHSLRRVFGVKSFLSMDEIRVQAFNKLPAARLQVPISSAVIDSMLMLPETEETAGRRAERLKQVKKFVNETGLLSQPLDKQSQEQMRRRVGSIECETQGKTVVFCCMPNAGVYELTQYHDPAFKNTCSKLGLYTFYWNYRGYGASTGSPCMRNLMSDGAELMKLMKVGFGFSKVILYGRSLGGHVVKSLAHEAKLAICDRTFSSIGLVAHSMFGLKWVQFGYQLLLDNYWHNVEHLINSPCPKIIITDPNLDEVIDYDCSLLKGITAELFNEYFKIKHVSMPQLKKIENAHPVLFHLPLFERVSHAFLNHQYHDFVHGFPDLFVRHTLFEQETVNYLYSKLVEIGSKAISTCLTNPGGPGVGGTGDLSWMNPPRKDSDGLMVPEDHHDHDDSNMEELREIDESVFKDMSYGGLFSELFKDPAGKDLVKRIATIMESVEAGGIKLFYRCDDGSQESSISCSTVSAFTSIISFYFVWKSETFGLGPGTSLHTKEFSGLGNPNQSLRKPTEPKSELKSKAVLQRIEGSRSAVSLMISECKGVSKELKGMKGKKKPEYGKISDLIKDLGFISECFESIEHNLNEAVAFLQGLTQPGQSKSSQYQHPTHPQHPKEHSMTSVKSEWSTEASLSMNSRKLEEDSIQDTLEEASSDPLNPSSKQRNLSNFCRLMYSKQNLARMELITTISTDSGHNGPIPNAFYRLLEEFCQGNSGEQTKKTGESGSGDEI